MSMRTVAFGFALLAGALGSPAAVDRAGAGPAGGGRERVVVSITEFAFTPKNVQVHVGDTITWVNNGTMVHTSTARNVWNSGNMAPGARFSFTFNATGTTPYRCNIHPVQMQGAVRVIP